MPVKQLLDHERKALLNHLTEMLDIYFELPHANFYSLEFLDGIMRQHYHMVQAYLGLYAKNNHNQEHSETYLEKLFTIVNIYLTMRSTTGVAHLAAGMFLHVNMKDVPTELLLDVLTHVEYKVDEHYGDMYSKQNPNVVWMFFNRAVTELARRGVV